MIKLMLQYVVINLLIEINIIESTVIVGNTGTLVVNYKKRSIIKVFPELNIIIMSSVFTITIGILSRLSKVYK